MPSGVINNPFIFVKIHRILLDPKPVYVYPSTVGPCGDPNTPTNNGVVPPEVLNYGYEVFFFHVSHKNISKLNISTSIIPPQYPNNPRCRFSLAESMDQSEFDEGLMYEFPCNPSVTSDFSLTTFYDGFSNILKLKIY